MKEKIRKIYGWDGFPFLILAAAMLLWHWFVPGLMKDDRYYWNVLNEQTTMEYLIYNWNNWTSRMFIETVAIWVEHLPMALWKVLDTAVYTLLGMVISRLLFRENRRMQNCWLVCLMLIYPFLHMSTAGWMTTTITYMWPLAAGLASCLYFLRVTEGKHITWVEYPLYVAAALYAGSLEQMSALMTAVWGSFCIWLALHGKKGIFPGILFLISAGNLTAALLCPGNHVRTASEIQQAFPDYKMLSLMDKVQLGYSATLEEVFFSPELLYLLLFGLIAVTVFLRTQDQLYRAAALVPASMAIVFGPARELFSDLFPGLSVMKEQFGMYGAVELGNFDWKRTYLPVVVLGMACVALVLSVYALYGSCVRGWLVILILTLGFSTRLVMGFSPTIWKSSDRTYLFLLFAVLMAAAMILHDFYDRYGKYLREGIGWVLGIGAFFSYISGLIQVF